MEWGDRRREDGEDTESGNCVGLPRPPGSYDGVKGVGCRLLRKIESREQMFGRWRWREEVLTFI